MTQLIRGLIGAEGALKGHGCDVINSDQPTDFLIQCNSITGGANRIIHVYVNVDKLEQIRDSR